MAVRRLSVAVGVTVLACVVVSAEAAVPPTPSNAQCAAAWNSATNARWHAYAAKLDVHRAAAFSWGVATPVNGKFVTTRSGCMVKLWLATRRGPIQDAEALYGDWTHGTALYGTPAAGGGRPGPRRLHTRTTAPFTNARVGKAGTLTFVGAASSR